VFLQNAAERPVRAFFNVYLDRGLSVAPSEIGLIMGLAQLLPVASAIFAVRLLTLQRGCPNNGDCRPRDKRIVPAACHNRGGGCGGAIGMALGSACTTAGGGFVISTVRFGGLFAVSVGPAACSAVLEYQSPARRAAHGAYRARGAIRR